LARVSNGGGRGGPERVVLLGYMCSGKSSVGRALARRLGWRFVDFDVEIERREAVSVRRIIEERGEEFFRSLEAALTAEVAEERGLVIAPGGAWITQPELLERLREGTLSAWLRVSPAETARRLKRDDIERPFRDLEDPTPQIASMLEEREPLFRRADLAVPTDGREVEEVAFEIEVVCRLRR
jgi:shikimate kinase